MASRNSTRKGKQNQMQNDVCPIMEVLEQFHDLRHTTEESSDDHDDEFAHEVAERILGLVNELPTSVISHALFVAIHNVVLAAAKPCADCGEKHNGVGTTLFFDVPTAPGSGTLSEPKTVTGAPPKRLIN